MRICPVCGHIDPICWRPASFHPEFMYAHLDGLQILEPDLNEALKTVTAGELLFKAPFVYWKSSRSPVVRRCWVEDYKIVKKTGSLMEKEGRHSGRPVENARIDQFLGHLP